MLEEATRTAILRLHAEGHGSRRIAHALNIARSTVRRVIETGSATVPLLVRAEVAAPWRERILELHARYQGHLGRVHDDLRAGADNLDTGISGFCPGHNRRIGVHEEAET